MNFEMVMKLIVRLSVIVATLALKLTIDNLSPREGETVTITCTIPSFNSSFASFTNVNYSKTWGTCSSDGTCHTSIAANFSTNATAMIMKKTVESADGGLILACTHDNDKGDLIIPYVASTTTTTATSPNIPPCHYQGLLIGLIVACIMIFILFVYVVICIIIYCCSSSCQPTKRNDDILPGEGQARSEQGEVRL